MLLLFIVTLGHSLHSIESSYVDSWLSVENLTSTSVTNFFSEHQSELQRVLTSTQISSNCRNSLEEYKDGIFRFDLNAIKRLDSSGKLPSGLLSGTFTDLGSYDSCIALESTQYCLLNTNAPLFNETGYEGFMRPYDKKLFNFKSEVFRYFSGYIHFLRRMNITTGLCVPEQCSREELTLIVNNFYTGLNSGLTGDVNLCYSKPKTVQWRSSEIIGITFVVIVVGLNFVGNWASKESYLSAFNWSKNAKKLFCINQKSESDSLTYLDGIKVFTMALVVMAHFQMGNMFNLYMESFKFVRVASNPTFIMVYLAPYTVDLFIMVSGLLMGYHFFSGKRRFNLVSYIVGRWMRFAAVLAWTICLQFVLFGNHFRAYFGGPLWSDYNAIGSIVDSCERTWFPTLLLNQFWFDNSSDANVCLLFDWYLAADFMLAVLFLLVLIPFIKNYKVVALFNTVLLIIVGLVVSGLGLYFLDVPTSWIATNFQRMPLIKYSFDFNLKPWPHMGPYFVGVLFSYILSKPKLSISKITLGLGWFVCILCLSTNFIYEYVVNRFGYDPDYPIALTYGIVSKTIWALGWAWIVLVFKLGHLSPISNFLSRPVFRILSRINLCVLCANLMIIRLRSGTTRTLTYPSYSEAILFNYLPMYIVIYLIAILSTILVEFPTVNLLRKVFNSRKSKSSKDQSLDQESNTVRQLAVTRIVISANS